jgi:hypothetical protein
LTTLWIGADRAERYTTRYEAHENNPTLEKEFDLESNAMGRKFAEEVRPRFGPFNNLTKYGEAGSKLSDLCYGASIKE